MCVYVCVCVRVCVCAHVCLCVCVLFFVRDLSGGIKLRVGNNNKTRLV